MTSHEGAASCEAGPGEDEGATNRRPSRGTRTEKPNRQKDGTEAGSMTPSAREPVFTGRPVAP